MERPLHPAQIHAQEIRSLEARILMLEAENELLKADLAQAKALLAEADKVIDWDTVAPGHIHRDFGERVEAVLGIS